MNPRTQLAGALCLALVLGTGRLFGAPAFSIVSGGLTFDPATPQRTTSDATSIGPWTASIFMTAAGTIKLSDPDGSTLQVATANGLTPYVTASYLNLTVFNSTSAPVTSIKVELRTTATTASTPGDGISFGQDLPPPITSIGSSITNSTVTRGPGDNLLFSGIRNGLGMPVGAAIGLVFPVTSTLTAGPAEIYLVITPNPGPPVITDQPQSQTVNPGARAVFTVAASSATPLRYQWKRAGEAIPNATAASFSIAAATTANAGTYTVDVSNSDGTTSSAPAVLTVGSGVFQGRYFGTLGGQGFWSMLLRADQSGTFVGYDRGTATAYLQSVLWKPDGTFAEDPAARSPLPDEPRGVRITGSILAGLVNGQLVGPNLSFTGNSDSDTGPAGALAGLYLGRALGATGGRSYAIIGASGRITAVVLASGFSDGISGTLAADGRLGATSAGGGQIAITVNGELRTFEAIVRPAGIVEPTTFLGTLDGLPGSARLINLSILTALSVAGESFTLGTVIGGGQTIGTKPLLVRAGGPALSALGVSGTLSDPRLDIFKGSAVIASNDNWGGTPLLTGLFTQVGAFPFASPGSLDAAIATGPLESGNYTVQVAGVGPATGQVIAELYDATSAGAVSASTPRLINVSVLKPVPAGETLTAGFVIGGTGPKQVLVRAVGPTLAQAPFNVPGVMADPRVELFRLGASTSLLANDNWGGTATLAAAAQNVGAFPLPPASRDAVILVVLSPGGYTAQVTGGTAGGGNVLVEVYEVP